jgi:hypothetical protein
MPTALGAAKKTWRTPFDRRRTLVGVMCATFLPSQFAMVLIAEFSMVASIGRPDTRSTCSTIGEGAGAAGADTLAGAGEPASGDLLGLRAKTSNAPRSEKFENETADLRFGGGECGGGESEERALTGEAGVDANGSSSRNEDVLGEWRRTRCEPPLGVRRDLELGERWTGNATLLSLALETTDRRRAVRSSRFGPDFSFGAFGSTPTSPADMAEDESEMRLLEPSDQRALRCTNGSTGGASVCCASVSSSESSNRLSESDGDDHVRAGVGSALALLPERVRDDTVGDRGVLGGAGNAPRTESRKPVVAVDERSGTMMGGGRRRAGELGDAGTGTAKTLASELGRGASSVRSCGATSAGVGVIERGSASDSEAMRICSCASVSEVLLSRPSMGIPFSSSMGP